jgi:hypothetical protein
MVKLPTAAENASNFKTATPEQFFEPSSSRTNVLRELLHTEYNCKEYPHVALKFLPGGILQIFAERKQPYIRRYSLKHISKTEWTMDVVPHLTNFPGELKVKIEKNSLTLTNQNGEVLHLNKLNLKGSNTE